MLKSSKDKAAAISANLNIFGRLLIVAKTRNVNLEVVLAYVLSSVPYALVHSDIIICKNMKVKSDLLVELESKVDVLPKHPLSDDPLTIAIIRDAMAMSQIRWRQDIWATCTPLLQHYISATWERMAATEWTWYLVAMTNLTPSRQDSVCDESHLQYWRSRSWEPAHLCPPNGTSTSRMLRTK